MDNREALMVPEKKDKILKIKQKYNNMQMSDDVAKKIRSLEITNNILLAATAATGIITVIDYIAPDPLPFADEAILSGLTGLLGLASSIVKNKIDDLAKTGNTSIQMEEVNKLTSQIANVAKNAKDIKKSIR